MTNPDNVVNKNYNQIIAVSRLRRYSIGYLGEGT